MRAAWQGLDRVVEGQEGGPVRRARRMYVLRLPSPPCCVLTLPRYGSAVTPTCSENHLPPYVEAADKFKSKGVADVYVVASNDVFVVSAWGRALHTTDKVKPIADSSLAWLKAAGLTQDRELAHRSPTSDQPHPSSSVLHSVARRVRRASEALRAHHRRPQGDVRRHRDWSRCWTVGRRGRARGSLKREACPQALA